MAQPHEDHIDLNKLSQREMLILICNKVNAIEPTLKELEMKQYNLELTMAILKTKIRIWSTIIGFVGGLVSSLAIFFITENLKK